MKIIITINPKFESLRNYINAIADETAEMGEIIYKARNVVYRNQIDGVNITTKCFRVPSIANRVIYSFFRKSKARRSFENASKLLEVGIGTPCPIAYIEVYELGLLSRSYYICEFIDGAQDIRWWQSRDNSEEILQHTAQFMGEVHSKNVWHKDFSPGNVLFDKDWNFYIIDLNRMKFGVNNPEIYMQNFSRLNDYATEIEHLARLYYPFCPFKCLTEDRIVELAIESHRKFWHRKHVLRRLKGKK